ncbi:hypothetical protein VP01_5883g1 [Puccinia sorghi]|uniref:DDE Tnp4 domain-containing protein n=1 Tax=Puccinia sorghi TaxID=27349 RepID=A0A0L6UHW2_9BASI|nr:hypothetical protein VP01_5883g1 [Puccinia sorghi]
MVISIPAAAGKGKVGNLISVNRMFTLISAHSLLVTGCAYLIGLKTKDLEFITDLILDSDTTEEDKTEAEDENDWINDIEEKALLLVAVQSPHYLRPCAQIEKAPPISDFLLNSLEDKHFKQQFRMPRVYFMKICNLVSRNSVFNNNSQHPQHPVEEQMMVELKRLGCFGNASSVGMLANYFGIAKGTVEIYTNRCIVAIKGLHEKFLKWPNTEARCGAYIGEAVAACLRSSCR